MKTFVLNRGDELSDEQRKEIKKAREKDLVIDEDCPSYSYDKLCEMLNDTKQNHTPIQSRKEGKEKTVLKAELEELKKVTI